MIIAVTGTPGTGKTSVSKELSKITGMRLVSLNDVAKEKKLYVGKDRKRGCMIVDVSGLQREARAMRKAGMSAIVESHFAHDMPADAVVVLRANPGTMRKRGMGKGWSKAKADENAQAEIMEVCRSEALEKHGSVMELDTTALKPKDAARRIALMLEREGLFVSRDLAIGKAMRKKLREPYGRLFPDTLRALSYARRARGPVFAVGDRVSSDMISAGVVPDVTVTDGRVNRKPVSERITLRARSVKAGNAAGSISPSLWRAVQGALSESKPVKVDVRGEEDIAVLPLMSLAPDGASIVYGLFRRGACVIRTGSGARKTARRILREIASGN